MDPKWVRYEGCVEYFGDLPWTEPHKGDEVGVLVPMLGTVKGRDWTSHWRICLAGPGSYMIGADEGNWILQKQVNDEVGFICDNEHLSPFGSCQVYRLCDKEGYEELKEEGGLTNFIPFQEGTCGK